jgi:hypothetical protein
MIDALHRTTSTHNWVLTELVSRINNSYTEVKHGQGMLAKKGS